MESGTGTAIFSAKWCCHSDIGFDFGSGILAWVKALPTNNGILLSVCVGCAVTLLPCSTLQESKSTPVPQPDVRPKDPKPATLSEGASAVPADKPTVNAEQSVQEKIAEAMQPAFDELGGLYIHLFSA